MTVLARPEVVLGGDWTPLDRAMSQASSALQTAGARMQRIGTRMSIAITAPLTALGIASVKAAADFDSLREGLRAVTGSTEEANRQFERLRDLAKLPSVTLDAAAQASVAFQSIGQSAEFAERAITGVGNAVALSGGGSAEFSGVMRQFRQISGLGRLMGEEMNVIIENAPAMAGAIQRAFGTTSVEAIRNMGLTSEEFFEKLFEGMEALPRTTGGAKTQLENMGLAARQAAAAIGDSMLPTIVPLVQRVTDLLMALVETNPEVVKIGVVLGGLAAVIGPTLVVLGALTASVGSLAGAFVAVNAVLASGGIAALIAGGGLIVALAAAAGGVGWLAEKLKEANAELAITNERVSTTATNVQLLAALNPEVFETLPDHLKALAGGAGEAASTTATLAEEIAELESRIRPVVVSAINPMTGALITLDEMMGRTNALRWADAIERGRQVTESVRTPTEVYAARVQELDYLLSQGAITQDTYTTAVKLAHAASLAQTNATKAQADAQKDLNNELRKATGFLGSIGSIASAFGLGIPGLGAVTSILGSIPGLGGIFGGGGKAKKFAGGFALGGTIPPGQWGIVGERGPEVVQGPANVTPMDGAGGTTIVQFPAPRSPFERMAQDYLAEGLRQLEHSGFKVRFSG